MYGVRQFILHAYAFAGFLAFASTSYERHSESDRILVQMFAEALEHHASRYGKGLGLS